MNPIEVHDNSQQLINELRKKNAAKRDWEREREEDWEEEDKNECRRTGIESSKIVLNSNLVYMDQHDCIHWTIIPRNRSFISLSSLGLVKRLLF